MTGQRHLLGFTLDTKWSDADFKCDWLDNNFFNLFFLITLRNIQNEAEPFKNINIDKVLKCKKINEHRELFSIIQLQREKIGDPEAIRKILLGNLKGDIKRVDHLVNIIRVKNEKLKMFLNDINFQTIESLLKGHLSCLKDHQICQEIKSKIEKSGSHFLKGFLGLILAIRSNNISWAKREIINLVSLPHEQFIFEAPIYFSLQYYLKKMSYGPYFFSFFSEIYKIMGDDIVYKLFLGYLFPYLGDVDFDRLKIGLKSDFTKIEIQDFEHHHFLNTDLTYFWYFYFLKNNEIERANKKLEENLMSKKINFFGDSIDLMEFIFSKMNGDNKKLKDQIQLLKERKDLYSQYLFMRVNLLLSLNSTTDLGLVQLTFWQKLLSSGLATDFAIFHLVENKYWNNDLLWWAAF